MTRTIWGMLCLSLAASIWGGMYVASKYVLDYLPPFTLLWLRYAIAVLVLGVTMIATKRHRVEKGDWRLFAGIGFVGYFLSVGTQFIGTKLSDAHTGSLITATTPVFVLLFARLWLKEALTVRKLVALVVAFIGIVIVIGRDAQGESSLAGSLFLVVAAATWALLSVLAKRGADRYPPLTITTYALLWAVLFTLPAMLWELSVAAVSPTVWTNPYILWGVLYLGLVSTAAAFFLWNKGMALMDAGTGAFFLFLQPVVGSFLGWLLLGESLTLPFFLGGLLIAAGVLIVGTAR
ncbi:EamA family transporter [Brevibacillus sp. SYP-B805]|uniref:DMT family transporter n=1 Tax=Brevibacillus sp. SYP-B805 TaxID=1578199 RepID=UPI0013ECCCD3|nr:EamA family transporter [Brevibacillus sp. SYP-B805]NGQ97032.1 EamA family transporter [Brevibacillus sp. SYP-B805]